MAKTNTAPVVLAKAPVSHVHLEKPDDTAPENATWKPDGKFKLTAIYDDMEPLIAIRKQCLEVAKAKWPDVDLDEVRLPFRERDEDEKNEYIRGKITVTAKSQYKPGVVDAKRKPLAEGVSVRGGDVCKIAVLPVPYEQTETITEFKKRKTVKVYGISLQLRGVQLIEKRAGGSVSDLFEEEDGFESSEAEGGSEPGGDEDSDF